VEVLRCLQSTTVRDQAYKCRWFLFTWCREPSRALDRVKACMAYIHSSLLVPLCKCKVAIKAHKEAVAQEEEVLKVVEAEGMDRIMQVLAILEETTTLAREVVETVATTVSAVVMEAAAIMRDMVLAVTLMMAVMVVEAKQAKEEARDGRSWLPRPPVIRVIC